MSRRFVIIGRARSIVRINGATRKKRKRAHIEIDGRSLCQVENNFAPGTAKRIVDNPHPSRVCRICLQLEARGRQSRPVVPVPGPTTDEALDRALSRWQSESEAA